MGCHSQDHAVLQETLPSWHACSRDSPCWLLEVTKNSSQSLELWSGSRCLERLLGANNDLQSPVSKKLGPSQGFWHKETNVVINLCELGSRVLPQLNLHMSETLIATLWDGADVSVKRAWIPDPWDLWANKHILF